jgi:RNA polymerase sigma-70 factor (ECF subfamily)
MSRASQQTSAPDAARFPATHWSLVLAAGAEDTARRAAALETLCGLYWEPLYAYLRRLGYTVHDAEDFTQGFFAHLLNGAAFDGLNPAKGKFRSFLLVALKHFVANAHVHTAAAKRGGGQVIVPLDVELGETHFAQEATGADTAERHFDRRWATMVLSRARARLATRYATAGKADLFQHLCAFLSREARGDDYERVAAQVGSSAGAVAVAVHRLRHQFRDAIRAEVAHTVATPAETDEEMRYLLEVLCTPG